jgi:hypothetical protein
MGRTRGPYARLNRQVNAQRGSDMSQIVRSSRKAGRRRAHGARKMSSGVRKARGSNLRVSPRKVVKTLSVVL